MVHDVQYISLGDGKCFRMIYHIGCENNHKMTIDGEIYNMPNDDSPEQRVIKYLIQQSEVRYG